MGEPASGSSLTCAQQGACMMWGFTQRPPKKWLRLTGEQGAVSVILMCQAEVSFFFFFLIFGRDELG